MKKCITKKSKGFNNLQTKAPIKKINQKSTLRDKKHTAHHSDQLLKETYNSKHLGHRQNDHR